MIELPGYMPVFDNVVYGSGSDKSVQDISVFDVLFLKKFIEVTKDDVCRYLSRKLDERKNFLKPNSKLDQLIHALPEEFVKGLYEGDEALWKIVKDNTEANKIPQDINPGLYIETSYGALPLDVVESGNYEFCDRAFFHENTNLFGEKWTFQVLFDKGFPNKHIMEHLLEARTHESRYLCVSIYPYPIDQVKEVLDTMYSGITDPKEIMNLVDVTEEFLEAYTLQSAIALLEEAYKDKKLGNKIKDLLSLFDEAVTKEKLSKSSKTVH